MTWRSVVISKPAKLRLQAERLVIEQDSVLSVPLEDIAVLVLESQEVVLTHPVLSACSKYGIAVYVVDETHLPCGVLLPFLQHYRSLKIHRLQESISLPLQKRLWLGLVKAKILNQAKCLEFLGISPQPLIALIPRVRSGDPDNFESYAAQMYFSVLLSGHSRNEQLWINSALNYAYAIIRGAIARSLVCHGLYPAWGIHHKNEYDAFCLADDFIEPFRGIVDYWVVDYWLERYKQFDDSGLLIQDKAIFVSFLHNQISIKEQKTTILCAVEALVESFVRAIKNQSADELVLPTLNSPHRCIQSLRDK